MRGASVFISSLLVAAACLHGQAIDYFPLDVGNVWIYRTAHGDEVVEVAERREVEGAAFFRVRSGLSGDLWLRHDGSGRVLRYDEERRREMVWYDFARRGGERYGEGARDVEVLRVDGSRSIALGNFERVVYQHRVGGAEEGFLPYVGLVYGEGKELVYARLSGVTVLNADGLGFGVARGKGYARLFLNNNSAAPVRLVFGSGQTYEVTLLDGAGKELYRWSEGKGFTLAVRQIDFARGETSWLVEVPEVAGAVTLVAELATTGRKFRASLPLGTGGVLRP